jgi:hypothetical protein
VSAPDNAEDARVAGRVVVIALGCLYLSGTAALFGFGGLARFSFFAVLFLLVMAITLAVSGPRPPGMTHE